MNVISLTVFYHSLFVSTVHSSQTHECNGVQKIVLTEDKIRITSPNYPLFYNPDTFCGFRFFIPRGKTFEISCSTFRVGIFLFGLCPAGSVVISTPDFKKTLCGIQSGMKLSSKSETQDEFFSTGIWFRSHYLTDIGFSCVVNARYDDSFTHHFSSYHCHCGIKNDQEKVVGGREARRHEYPWHVGLIYKDQLRETPPFCGASLITNKHVLTAAHCVDELHGPIQTLLAEHDIKEEDNHVQKINVVQIKKHPFHQQGREQDYDFAILTLEYSIQFSRTIRPICLPNKDDELNVGMKGTITGWGHTSYLGNSSDVLKEVNVKVLNKDSCNQVYRRLTSRMFCAGSEIDGIDSCHGDSGGPLIVLKGINFEQVGVVSFGTGCGLSRYPGVYARTSTVISWIHQETMGSVTCPRN